MAAKRFAIETPEQLRELAALAKETPNSLGKLATVWSATRRRQGATNCDKTFYACFSGTRSREAAVIHFNSGHELTHQVDVQYNKALQYCERNLKPVYD